MILHPRKFPSDYDNVLSSSSCENTFIKNFLFDLLKIKTTKVGYDIK